MRFHCSNQQQQQQSQQQSHLDGVHSSNSTHNRWAKKKQFTMFKCQEIIMCRLMFDCIMFASQVLIDLFHFERFNHRNSCTFWLQLKAKIRIKSTKNDFYDKKDEKLSYLKRNRKIPISMQFVLKIKFFLQISHELKLKRVFVFHRQAATITTTIITTMMTRTTIITIRMLVWTWQMGMIWKGES